ncbi:hypothetical protein [Lysinibacter cavernae]|uniref:Uncharacterized protein n=1 Tax=Lysinibacter cavernae TaxID=1640652 RepID=A0A7X5R252_9MICO|nr:hypothetical protein [Lysinibacter cavernae]NIH54226.1 hypothetical protein [Lysinibacter cavernae]
MNAPGRPSNVRRYAIVAAFMVAILASAVVITTWGFLALFSGADPITKDVPLFVGPLMVGFGMIALLGILLSIGRELLLGRPKFPWLLAVFAGIGPFLVTGIAGFLSGLPPTDTFSNSFVLAIVPIGWLAALLYWAVTVRQIFTDRPRPRWRWENEDDE